MERRGAAASDTPGRLDIAFLPGPRRLDAPAGRHHPFSLAQHHAASKLMGLDNLQDDPQPSARQHFRPYLTRAATCRSIA